MLPFLLHLSFNISEQKDASALLASLNNSHSGVHNQKQTPFLSIKYRFENHFDMDILFALSLLVWRLCHFPSITLR